MGSAKGCHIPSRFVDLNSKTADESNSLALAMEASLIQLNKESLTGDGLYVYK